MQVRLYAADLADSEFLSALTESCLQAILRKNYVGHLSAAR